MKTYKIANILFVSVFLIFILLGMAVTIFKPKESVSYYENRTLAAQPEIKAELMLESDYFYRWERFLTDHAAARSTLVRLGAYIDLNIVKRPVVNDVITVNTFSGDDLYLGFNAYETIDPQSIRNQAVSIVTEIKSLSDVITGYGGSLYYVSVPAHYAWYADQYPWYLNNRAEYTSLSLEEFRDAMLSAGLNHIAIGDILPEIFDPPRLYSLSDHHYTFRGAYETYRAIIDRINSDGLYTLPFYSEDDLTFSTLENPFLGSRMRRILSIPGLTEHIEIAVPNEEVSFTRTDNGRQREIPTVYSLPYNVWDVVDYTIYMGGDVPETVIETGRDLPSVLIFGDSSTNAVECLMYLSCGEFRSVDLRHYKEMPLSAYVEKYRPDIVIGIRGYEVLLEMTGNGVLTGS